MTMPENLTIQRPDDWHLHLRDDSMLQTVLPSTVQHFARAIVMPNLTPPVTSLEAARAYRKRIIAALPRNSSFQPLMTLYLTEQTTGKEVQKARESGDVFGIKLYPAGATTHSDAGVLDIENVYPVLQAMAECDMPLLVHAEVADPDVDIFDREARFIDQVLEPLTNRFDNLRVVLEHVSTRHGVEFVRSRERHVAATITPQHLYMNRNAILAGGIRPHNYCLPVLKRESDREALVAAATSGDTRFFIGTDSAPHTRSAKENACGCAGTFNAPAALSIYAQVFEHANALDKLENFLSIHGPNFYGLPVNTETLALEKLPAQVPMSIGENKNIVTPWLAGQTLQWRVRNS